VTEQGRCLRVEQAVITVGALPCLAVFVGVVVVVVVVARVGV